MKWKQVYQDERDAIADVELYDVRDSSTGRRAPYIAVPMEGFVGKHIRITVEEAVDEQARKGLLAYGGAEARRIHDAAFPHAPLESGRNIRITMEEEVSKCCEKWRRLTAGNDDCRDGSRWLRVKYDPSCMTGLYGPVVFCPECRKPL